MERIFAFGPTKDDVVWSRYRHCSDGVVLSMLRSTGRDRSVQKERHSDHNCGAERENDLHYAMRQK
jgi:hypothetical protein